MTPAERAKACKRFRLWTGMLVGPPGEPAAYRLGNCERVDGEDRWEIAGWEIREKIPDDWLPVVEDRATAGCIEALAREAWAPEVLCCHAWLDNNVIRWNVGAVFGEFDITTEPSATPVEAWIAALEAKS